MSDPQRGGESERLLTELAGRYLWWPPIGGGKHSEERLYGGTAVALHRGHRQSGDFDFFSRDPLDQAALRASLREARDSVRDLPPIRVTKGSLAG